MNKKVDTLEDLLLHTIYKFDAEYIYGRISTRASLSIKRLTGFNLYNYLFVLDSGHLKHFYEQHFDEEREHKRNQRGFHFDDLKKLMLVINQHEAVELGNKPNRIKFKKTFPGLGLFQLVVEIDKKKETISGKSFRVKT